MREGPSILELRRHVDLLSRGVPPNIPRIEVRDLRSGANFQSRFWVRFESTGTSVARWRVSARDLHNSVMYILGSSDNLGAGWGRTCAHVLVTGESVERSVGQFVGQLERI